MGIYLSIISQKIKTLQNKAVKHIEGVKYYDRATPFYWEIYILKLLELYKLEVSKLTYNYIHRPTLVPEKLSTIFSRVDNISQRTTRSSKKQLHRLYIPWYQSNKMQKSIKYQGVKI